MEKMLKRTEPEKIRKIMIRMENMSMILPMLITTIIKAMEQIIMDSFYSNYLICSNYNSNDVK